MSELDSKLERQAFRTEGRARRTWASLKDLPAKRIEYTPGTKQPARIEYVSMGQTWRWSLVSGRGDSAVFELEEA
jgi:hypothetical protein